MLNIILKNKHIWLHRKKTILSGNWYSCYTRQKYAQLTINKTDVHKMQDLSAGCFLFIFIDKKIQTFCVHCLLLHCTYTYFLLYWQLFVILCRPFFHCVLIWPFLFFLQHFFEHLFNLYIADGEQNIIQACQ